MNPDKDDPNNHVPAVAPDDDWDGLDVEQVFDAQLPPRRVEATRLPKIDLNHKEVSLVEPVRFTSDVVPRLSESHLKTYVPIHLKMNSEREEGEKEDFLPALVMEDLKQGDFSPRGIQKPILQSRSQDGERNDWGVAQKKESSRWMLYTALGVILLIVTTVSISYINWDKYIRNIDKNGSNRSARNNIKKESNIDQDLLGRLTSSDKEATQIYGKYAQAKSLDDFTGSIYLSKSNTQFVAKVWAPIGADSDWVPSDTSAWKTHQNGSQLFAELKGVNHNFSKFIAVFRYENTQLKMDWKATTGYGSASFTELKSGTGDGSEIRGWIESSSFFTQELPEERYHSFVIRSADKRDSVWGYSEIGSVADTDLMKLFAKSSITGESIIEAKVILNMVSGDRGMLPQQWIIKSLIAENWLDQATP
jgi:hypothetical protein